VRRKAIGRKEEGESDLYSRPGQLGLINESRKGKKNERKKAERTRPENYEITNTGGERRPELLRGRGEGKEEPFYVLFFQKGKRKRPRNRRKGKKLRESTGGLARGA